jgi:hypothetical protein
LELLLSVENIIKDIESDGRELDLTKLELVQSILAESGALRTVELDDGVTE